MKKNIIALIMLTTMTACSHYSDNSPTLQHNELLHRNFVLIRFNDTPIEPRNMQPSLEFGENLYVTARMCNYFSGQGQLNHNQLTINHITLSQLPCLEPKLKALDTVVPTMFRQGVVIHIDKQSHYLTLSDNNNTLLFKPMDWIY